MQGTQPLARPSELTTPALRLASFSPLVIPALVPMVFLVGFVAILVWISFQRGLVGTAAATYSLDNYTDVFADPLTYRALVNTLIFATTTTVMSLLIGLTIA